LKSSNGRAISEEDIKNQLILKSGNGLTQLLTLKIFQLAKGLFTGQTDFSKLVTSLEEGTGNAMLD